MIIPMTGMAEIEAVQRHRLIHWTCWERAICILEQGRIHGSTGFSPLSLEAYPHFLLAGWRNVNHLDVSPDVALLFTCHLPARHRGEGTDLPESGWLEIYSIQGTPWQCSLHPDSPPLELVSVEPVEPYVRPFWILSKDGREEKNLQKRWRRALAQRQKCRKGPLIRAAFA